MEQFFNTSWILPNFNVNTLILILKSTNVDSIEMFIHVSLNNLKFKIISTVLADRMSSVMPIIISKEKKRFLKGRCIKDYIGFTSETTNLTHKKSSRGNLSMKVGITKDFDSLN